MQYGGEARVLGPYDQVSDSDYTVNGNIGGNEWYLDGAANSSTHIVAHVPHSDTVAEMKVETSGFDASFGHTTGVALSIMTKSGTNQLHGSASDLHTEDRWNAAAFFPKQLYYKNIAAAEASGDHALAERLRNTPLLPSGHKNHYALTLGGPVVIPKVFNGKDKLFFFFDYVGLSSISTTASYPQYLNNTFPTMANRQGDFSQLLQVDAVRYTVYDPLSVRPDPARPGHYIRDPIPGNILPAARIVNPVYNAYVKFLPVPNNDPANPRNEPLNNYLGVSLPYNNKYNSFSSRVDYNHSNQHRMYLRWLWDNMNVDSQDWAYTTVPGLMRANQSRHNSGAVADWVYTPRASTMFDFSVSINEYRDDQTGQGNGPVAQSYKPSDVGLPAYLDTKAGDKHTLPLMAVSGYNNIGPAGAQSFNHYRVMTTKADASHIRGRHSLHAGFDGKQYFLTGYGGAAINTSGNFSFGNTYTRRNDDTFTPAGSLGLSWAAFMMGIPDSMTINTTDSYAMHNPAYAWYGQDNWRVTSKLNLNFGLRLEYELGPTERYNRMLGYFDPSLSLPIAAAAQAAYARQPVPELSASSFVVQGGSTYAATGGVGRRIRQNEWMWLPRIAAAYQIDSRTVLRGGYGIFYDTLNVLVQNGWNTSQNPNQLNFSRTTSTQISNDFGTTWLAGDPLNGVSPLRDPFPVRAGGTRFDIPIRTALGAMAVAGRSLTFSAFDSRRARQQRWRAGVQRQIGRNMIFEAVYSGSYSDRAYVTKKLDPLPAQFWATGLVRNDAVANNMNANVPNPFLLANFAGLKTTDPLVYQDMSTLGFYTSTTVRKNQLLRPYPQMTNLNQRLANAGDATTHDLELSFERRFSRGFNAFVGYTRMKARTADVYLNEFDPAPTERESNNARPHRVIANGIWELPFGKGRAFAQRGIQNLAFGGWQIGLTYEFQPGALLDFGNLFYYGDLGAINSGNRTFDRWFNTDGFERSAAKGPNSYHARVFPTRIDGLRADFTNVVNSCLQREFRFRERATVQFRVDALNLQNRSQMAAPVVDPTSTNFGKITTQSRTQNRYYQFQLRFRF